MERNILVGLQEIKYCHILLFLCDALFSQLHNVGLGHLMPLTVIVKC
jgi:hypothetical protein